MNDAPNDGTHLLFQLSSGDAAALDALLPRIYTELRGFGEQLSAPRIPQKSHLATDGARSRSVFETSQSTRIQMGKPHAFFRRGGKRDAADFG